MACVSFIILLILACIEGSLAIVREQIVENNNAILETLTGKISIETSQANFALVVQMSIGFIMPVILTLSALPLETFIHSFRTVIGVLTSVFLRFFSYVLRLFANLSVSTGEIFISLYDLIIFPVIFIDNTIKNKKKSSGKKKDNIDKEDNSDSANNDENNSMNGIGKIEIDNDFEEGE